MALTTDPGRLFSLATALLLVAMGVYIWRIAPRRRENTALAVFVAAWGLNIAAKWSVPVAHPLFAPLGVFANGPVGYAVAFAALALSRDFGGRGSHVVERRRLWIVAPLAFATLPINLALQALFPQYAAFAPLGTGVAARWTMAVVASGWAAAVCAMLLLLALAALRFPEGSRDRPAAANAILLLTFGVGAFWAYSIPAPPDPQALPPFPGRLMTLGLVGAVVSDALLLGLVVLWLRNAGTCHERFSPRARWVAWALAAAMLAGFVAQYRTGYYDEAAGVASGLVRLFALGALAYAILKHQLLGVDVKLRWAISKSTVAGAFVAVFFLASEGAQILFGQGNEWLGLLGAGALVFALAPLQRAAERLAERAVPVATAPAAGPAPARGADSYRRAVRLALKDRRLTHEEEVELATVAHDLGLTAPEATRIRFEVERETGADGGEAASSP